MGRRPCCSKEGMNRGAWSAREDKILTDYIKTHGEGKWRDLPKRAGLRRCGKSCRLRWLNYLRPNIKRGNISEDEEELIIRLHKLLGNRWSLIAGRLPGRTDNEIKNYWNTNLSKKVKAHADQSNKQKGLKSKSKKTTMRFINDEASPKSVEQSHPIIRTKAVRCKRVFIPPLHGDRISKPICEESPSSLVPQDVDSSNLFVDFDMEEFISSIQDDDFLQDCMNDIGYDGNIMFGDDRDNKRSPCSDHPLPNEEAMIGDWRGSDSLQVKVTSQLKTLASLLDSEEEWLEK